jgi:hypothetical protein
MGLLDLYSRTAGTTDTPLQALPRSLGERVEATAAETFAPDRYFNLTGSRRDAWQRAVDELHTATGEAFANPYGPVTPEEMMRLGNQPAVETERRNRIIEASRMARESYPDLSDPELIDRAIGEEGQRRRDTAARLQGTGNGVLNFLAGAVLETATPHGIVGTILPIGSRLPTAANAARTFLGNVGREAAVQAGFNAATQAGAEVLDFLSRSETGTPQGAGEVLGNIAGAAVIGGAIGGGVRALYLKWKGLPEKVRADAPLEVKDAFRQIEADVLYSGQNRLGVDPLLHERYQGNAMDAVMRGRPVDLADLTRGADTPLTAVGRALGAPDAISVRGLEGLGTAMDRVRALPDREIESFAREIAPRSFERLDKVEAELSQARARLAEIENRSLDVADLLDPETGMRLKEIETDLQAPALSRKQRTALEQERDMIMQSVDPADRLPKKAEQVLRRQKGEIEKAIAKLEAQREEAAETASKATGKLRSKLEAKAYAPGFEWAGTLEQLERGLAKGLGFTEPKGFGDAMARAEMMRQARILRDVLPDGAAPRTSPTNDAPAPKATEAISPEMQKALDTETKRLVEGNPQMEVEIGGRTMSAKEAMDDADRMAKDAQAALGCAMGSL